MRHLAKKAFTTMVNNWIIKPVQSMMEKEFPTLKMIAAMNTLFGVKEPIRITNEQRPQNRL